MHTPTKAQWQKVIDNFHEVLPTAQREDQFDMSEPHVNMHGYKCNTVHCMGSWYAIATMDVDTELDFHDGAHKMAKDLGFEDQWELASWAYTNHTIWGNSNGDLLFTSEGAYNNAKTLAEAVTYLEGVRDRSPENPVAHEGA